MFGTTQEIDPELAADNMGYLNGAKNSEIKDTIAAEAYYQYLLTDNIDVSVDAQWIKDSIEDDDNPEGLLLGLRVNLSI